jgi:uncharacterized phage protein (TIGR02216 family)
MAFAIQAFGIQPGAFWRMGLRELLELAEGMAALSKAAPSRGNLEELMARFPDGSAAKGGQDGTEG